MPKKRQKQWWWYEDKYNYRQDCVKLEQDKALAHVHTAVGFPITRVREPDKDDWAKMVHLAKINGTTKLPLIMSAHRRGISKTDYNIGKWWIGGSLQVSPSKMHWERISHYCQFHRTVSVV